MNAEPAQQYADRAPKGYRLASNKQTITPNDLVFFSSSDKRDADWVRPKIGEGVIGTCVHDHWPTIMGLAVPAK
jgi:hypothetical protein